MAKASRRALRFDSFDDVMPEVDRLLRSGYQKGGNWSLGQVCHHLTETLHMTLNPPPKKAPWIIRKLFAKPMFRHILRKEAMPIGIKGPVEIMPDVNTPLDDAAEAERLREAIATFQANVPDVMIHPFFEQISRADLTKLQVIHSAHHLGFLK